MTLFPILNKPKYGEPCNRCGECCRLELCFLANVVFEGCPAPCPALEYHDGLFACGLIIRPDFYITQNWPAKDRLEMKQYVTPRIQAVLGIGQGCGMPDEEPTTI